MEATLIAHGITDEQERLEIILARMMEQEAQINNPPSQDTVKTINASDEKQKKKVLP